MGLIKKSKKKILEENRIEEEAAPQGAATISAEAQRLLDSGRDFEKSRIEDNNKKTKLAFKVAAGFAVIALAEAAALASLAPMKTVVPYVIKVDKNTGYTSVEQQYDPVKDSSQEMDRFFVRQYIIARESYDWYSIQSDSNFVQAMSSSDVFSRYSNVLRSEKGPLSVLGDDVRANISVKSITFLDESRDQSTVQVRFQKTFETVEGMASTSRSSSEWLATITYDYSDEKISEVQKDMNPLNIRVRNYRLDKISGGGND